MAFTVQKAKREQSKARICLTGTSGSGKTVGSLFIAYGMTNDWNKVALIDTERKRSLFYANRSDLDVHAKEAGFTIGEFNHIDFEPPFTVDRYIEAMKAAQEVVGSDGVVIIDSGSHAWKGTGGVLEYKENVAEQRGKTDFSAWNDAGKVQNKFIDAIMDLDCHVIITLRSKSEYVQEKDPETGKSTVKKLGLKPEQRDDFEYEFMLVLDLDKTTHKATIIKDNTFLEAQGFFDTLTPELGRQIKEWISDGKEREVIRCEECGSIIKGAEGRNGYLSPQEVADNAKNTFGKQLCMDCCIKLANAENDNNDDDNEEKSEE